MLGENSLGKRVDDDSILNLVDLSICETETKCPTIIIRKAVVLANKEF